MVLPALSLCGLFLGPFINRFSPGELELYQKGILFVDFVATYALLGSVFLITDHPVLVAVFFILAYLLYTLPLLWVLFGIAAGLLGTSLLSWYYGLFVYALLHSLSFTRKQVLWRALYFALGFLPFYLL